MAINGISASPAAGIDNVLAQLRLAQARAQPGVGASGGTAAAQPIGGPGMANASGQIGGTGAPLRGTLRLSADDPVGASGGAGGGSFLSALKSSLDQVSNGQIQASQLGQKFEKGQGNVDLNDVMVAMQKANVNFQGAIQVRNRMVSAYHDIMNMQL
jgi:flagellar hook-basal body complex protein FliE